MAGLWFYVVFVFVYSASVFVAFLWGDASGLKRARKADREESDDPPRVPDPGHIPSSVKRQGYETRQARAEAQREELELRWRKGELVEVEDVIEVLDRHSSVTPGTQERIREELTEVEPEA